MLKERTGEHMRATGLQENPAEGTNRFGVLPIPNLLRLVVEGALGHGVPAHRRTVPPHTHGGPPSARREGPSTVLSWQRPRTRR